MAHDSSRNEDGPLTKTDPARGGRHEQKPATSTLGLLLGLALAPAAYAQGAPPAITEAEAHAIGVDAYVYFYPLVTMDMTRKQFTNIEPGKVGSGPMNMFANVPAYPAGRIEGGRASQLRHALFQSPGWTSPRSRMVVSVPDTGGRYYLLPMLDMWTDVFASPGWRTTGTQAGNFLVTPPGWRPDLRERFIEEFKLPRGHPAHRRADALCLDHRPHQDRRPAGL